MKNKAILSPGVTLFSRELLLAIIDNASPEFVQTTGVRHAVAKPAIRLWIDDWHNRAMERSEIINSPVPSYGDL